MLIFFFCEKNAFQSRFKMFYFENFFFLIIVINEQFVRARNSGKTN